MNSTIQMKIGQLSRIIFLFGIIGFNQTNAKDMTHGIVSMRGVILDSACSLDILNRDQTRDQTIDMLSHPISEIISRKSSLDRPFSIHLVNCTLKNFSKKKTSVGDQNFFKITFDGTRDHNDFGVMGNAEGVVLQIRDADGNIAVPGHALPAGNIAPESMTLNYTMRLIGNGQNLLAGGYHSTIRYKLDYY